MTPATAPPRAISLDLDDTLWPIWPVIEKAEQALHDFLCERCPRTAAAFPIPRMRELRERIAAEHPQFAHDFTHQRKLSLAHALREAGEDELHVEAAFTAFYAARNRIEFYPDAVAALQRLTARWPVAALTNGNADLASIGIAPHFATCERLGVAPHEVLHVGDDPLLDVHGAREAGLRTCWINRRNEAWPEQFAPPDLQFDTLCALADWLDARHPHPETA